MSRPVMQQGTEAAQAMYRVFGMSSSGNCHKVKLLLEQAKLPYEWCEKNILQGESRTPEYLAMNPNGRVPLLQIGSDTWLPESNAILYYLAEATPFFPAARLQRAQVLQWLFFEQYSHEPYIAVARFICRYLPAGHERRAEIPRLLERGHQALQVMQRHLEKRRFFVGEHDVTSLALRFLLELSDARCC